VGLRCCGDHAPRAKLEWPHGARLRGDLLEKDRQTEILAVHDHSGDGRRWAFSHGNPGKPLVRCEIYVLGCPFEEQDRACEVGRSVCCIERASDFGTVGWRWWRWGGAAVLRAVGEGGEPSCGGEREAREPQLERAGRLRFYLPKEWTVDPEMRRSRR
jgi:hypothetical protein